MILTLEPVHTPEFASKELGDTLWTAVREMVFDPLPSDVQPVHSSNRSMLTTAGAVVAALQGGTLWYDGRAFRGQFNAAVSRELRAWGARFSVSGFLLEDWRIPIELRGVIAETKARRKQTHEELLGLLALIPQHARVAPVGISFHNTIDRLLAEMQTELEATFVDSARAVKPPPPDQALVTELEQAAGREAEREVRAIVEDTVEDLRIKVEENAAGDSSPERLRGIVAATAASARARSRKAGGEAASRAAAEFRKRRYLSAGFSRYVWSTSQDERVRPTHGGTNDHRSLHGREFAWDSPPVVDSATARRCHPGEDYGPCRCVARPVIRVTA